MIKNVILPDRVQVNKYALTIQPGVGTPLFTKIGGLEEELDKAELPDRTSRSGGRSKQIEFEVEQPLHHDVDLILMETWYLLCKHSLPGYLKLGIYTAFDEFGLPRIRRTLTNLWISKRKETDNDLDDEGKMATVTWTLQADEIIPS